MPQNRFNNPFLTPPRAPSPAEMNYLNPLLGGGLLGSRASFPTVQQLDADPGIYLNRGLDTNPQYVAGEYDDWNKALWYSKGMRDRETGSFGHEFAHHLQNEFGIPAGGGEEDNKYAIRPEKPFRETDRESQASLIGEYLQYAADAKKLREKGATAETDDNLRQYEERLAVLGPAVQRMKDYIVRKQVLDDYKKQGLWERARGSLLGGRFLRTGEF